MKTGFAAEAASFTPQLVMWSAPVLCLLIARAIEAGFGVYVSIGLGCTSIMLVLNRKRLDSFFWRVAIGEDSQELREMRVLRQSARHVRAQRFITTVLCCGVLFHLSRMDYSGALVPALIVTLYNLLGAERGRYIVYFINGVAFNVLCFERGGGNDEAFFWSPVVILPIWNLMVIERVSTHAALELWRLAAVLLFLVTPELRLTVATICVLIAACRILEANFDLSLVVARRTEQRVSAGVNAERKQLIGVLAHEVRNRLDILTNSIAAASVCRPTAATSKEEGQGVGVLSSHSVVQQSVLMQHSVSVVLDLLDIEVPKTSYDTMYLGPSLGQLEKSLTSPTPHATKAQVRTHLGLLIQSAKQLQLEVSSHNDSMNAAAKFVIDLDPALQNIDILTNRSRLHWILRHLVANAYAGCGHDVDASVRVVARLSDNGQKITLEVINTGKAHDQGTLDVALQDHRQGMDCRTRRWNGHGLGLRHVVAMLHVLDWSPLELTASDTTVTARFVIPYEPCSADGEDLAHSSAATGAAMAQPTASLRNILVVDDEEFIRAITVMCLEMQSPGCEVVTADNGQQGIAVYLDRRNEEPPEFDLILMDIQMPVLTGDLAVKQLRTLERQHGWPKTCILARTANTGDADQEHYRQCGMDGCIPKSGNVAKQVLDALMIKRTRPDEFITIDPHLSDSAMS